MQSYNYFFYALMVDPKLYPNKHRAHAFQIQQYVFLLGEKCNNPETLRIKRYIDNYYQNSHDTKALIPVDFL